MGSDYTEIDSRYHSLLRIGGIALVLTGVAYTVCLILTLAVPPSSGTAASYLQATGPKAGLVTTLWVTYMISDLLLVPALLALYIVLKEGSRVLLLVGTALVAGYLVFDIAITEPNWLALAALASGYAGASSSAQQSYIGAAQYGLALVPYLNALSFAVSGGGFLLISIVMLRSNFRRLTAMYGIAVMVLAIVAGISWFVPALALTINATLGAFALWSVLVGVQLVRFGARVGRSAAERASSASPTTRPRATAG